MDVNGEITAVCGKNEEGFWLKFPPSLEFSVSLDGTSIKGWSRDAVSLDAVRHQMLNQVLPRVLSLGGNLVLHASAIGVGDASALFLGASGSGKSTLATSLSRSGSRLLADDAVLIEEVGNGDYRVFPSYPGVRVWPDSLSSLGLDREEQAGSPGSESHPHIGPRDEDSFQRPHMKAGLIGAGSKRSLQLHDAASKFSESMPLRRIYQICPGGGRGAGNEVRISPLCARDSFIAILGNSFQLDLWNRSLQEELFKSISRLITAFPVADISYPRDYSKLPAVREAVLTDLRSFI